MTNEEVMMSIAKDFPPELDSLWIEQTPRLHAMTADHGVHIGSVLMDGKEGHLERVEHNIIFVADSQIQPLINWLKAYQRSKKARG